MSKCQCTFAQRATGDGCRYCNPQEFIDRLLDSADEEGTQAATGIEALVCADIARRQEFGLGKYGTTVAENPLELRAWLQHLYEEQLDACVYTRRAIEELDKIMGSTGMLTLPVKEMSHG
ncbi:hypothetical protein GCM10027082_24380 [Comamonas humi]